MTIKKGEFIELEYTGKLKEEDMVFDTTDKDVAKENGIDNNPNAEYEPIKVCVGQSMVLPGLDEDIEGKEIGKDYSIDIFPEKGFGKKDAKKIQLIPLPKFKKQNINPAPGLQVQIDGQMGTVKVITGGRVMVDFNHPLSGKDLTYSYKIIKKIDDNKVKITSYVKSVFGFDWDVEEKDGKYVIKTKQELPEQLNESFVKKFKELIDDKAEYVFESEQKAKPEAKAISSKQDSAQTGDKKEEKKEDKPEANN